jgi:hypothetical protein
MGPSSTPGSNLAEPDRLPTVPQLQWVVDALKAIDAFIESTRTHTLLDAFNPLYIAWDALKAMVPVSLAEVGVPRTRADAPLVIQIPPAVQEGLDRAYDQTVEDGLETGGTLVRDKRTGEILIVNLGGSNRTDSSVEPDFNVDPARYEVVGDMHTHPPANSGKDTAFSPDDFAHMLNLDISPAGQLNTMVLKSGDTQFLLLRTAGSARDVDAAELRELGYAKVRQFMDAGKSPAEATQMVNKYLAERYGLVYYESRGGGTFERVSR